MTRARLISALILQFVAGQPAVLAATVGQQDSGSPLRTDVSALGATYNVELIGNASRLNAFLGVAASKNIGVTGAMPTSTLPNGYLQARFPHFRRLRIGNLFFGYECLHRDLKELAVRGPNGELRYQFDETLKLIDELLRGGLKPQFALTGIPRALVPYGEAVIEHRANGCVNAPAIDWSKKEPKDRVAEWWQLQDAFMQALEARFGSYEVKTWSFATWTEPLNPSRRLEAHLVLPESVVRDGRHDEAVATIIAASIDVAMLHGVPIHIGNFAGQVEREYPKIISQIKRFSRGEEYLAYIEGYAISRYRANPRQNFARMLEGAFGLLDDPAMPDKPLLLDEFGDLAGEDGAAPYWPASSYQNAHFVGDLLVRVFNRQDGTARVPRSVAFWNYLITPRAKEFYRHFDDYLKTPTSNVIAMFAAMNGYRKLPVSGPGSAISGWKNGVTRLIVIGQSDAQRMPGDSRIGQDPIRIEFHGLKPNARYFIGSAIIDGHHGNPISVFLEGQPDYRHDPKRYLVSDGKKWALATGRAQRCYFDEDSSCAWRDRGRRLDAPVLSGRSANSDKDGVLVITVGTRGVIAQMLELVEMPASCPKASDSIHLDFNSGLDWLTKIQLNILKNVSLDAGAPVAGDVIINDERNQGLRFHDGAQVVVSCSPLHLGDGHIKLRFKIDPEAAGEDMVLFQAGESNAGGILAEFRKGALYVGRGSADARRQIAFHLPKEALSAWNALEVGYDKTVLQARLNGRLSTVSQSDLDAPASSGTDQRVILRLGMSGEAKRGFRGVMDDLTVARK